MIQRSAKSTHRDIYIYICGPARGGGRPPARPEEPRLNSNVSCPVYVRSWYARPQVTVLGFKYSCFRICYKRANSDALTFPDYGFDDLLTGVNFRIRPAETVAHPPPSASRPCLWAITIAPTYRSTRYCRCGFSSRSVWRARDWKPMSPPKTHERINKCCATS